MTNPSQNGHVHNLPIGSPCVWYDGADTKTKPAPAVVESSNGKGMLNLLLLRNGSNQLKRNVYHVSSDEFSRRTNLAALYGGWDYVGQQPYAPQADIGAALTATTPPPPTDSVEQQVISLHKAGKGPAVIATMVGVPKEKVTAILDQAK